MRANQKPAANDVCPIRCHPETRRPAWGKTNCAGPGMPVHKCYMNFWQPE